MKATLLMSLLAAAAITGSKASAQFLINDTKTARWAGDYGGSWLGGGVSTGATLRRQRSWTSRLASAQFDMSARVNFLKQTKEAFSVFAMARAWSSGFGSVANQASGSQGEARLKIRLAGSTIVDQKYTQTMSLGYKAYRKDLFPEDISYGLSLGPVSFSIGGNVGVGCGRTAALQFPVDDISVGASAAISGWGYGRARVSLLVIGADAIADFARTTLSTSASVGLKSGFDAKVDLSLRAISLKIVVWLDLWLKSWKKTLVNLHGGDFNTTLLDI